MLRCLEKLGTRSFFDNRRRRTDFDYDACRIVELLVCNRGMAPTSKMAAWQARGSFPRKCDFSLADVYRSPDYLDAQSSRLVNWLNDAIEAQWGERDATTVYYDVTNCLFECDDDGEGGLRRRGVSKERRPSPVVQMGPMIDAQGIPISYDVFPGNANVCLTMVPVMKKGKAARVAGRYVRERVVDAKTGELHKSVVEIDEAAIAADAELDGYHCIVTSEEDKSAEDVVDVYRGLWRIEESFRVTKSDFAARPACVSTEAHIRAHFLICYLALVVMRLMQRDAGHKYSATRISEALRKLAAHHMKENWYLQSHRSDVTDDLKKASGLDFFTKMRSKRAIADMASRKPRDSKGRRQLVLTCFGLAVRTFTLFVESICPKLL